MTILYHSRLEPTHAKRVTQSSLHYYYFLCFWLFFLHTSMFPLLQKNTPLSQSVKLYRSDVTVFKDAWTIGVHNTKFLPPPFLFSSAFCLGWLSEWLFCRPEAKPRARKLNALLQATLGRVCKLSPPLSDFFHNFFSILEKTPFVKNCGITLIIGRNERTG